jgi:LDH2 family malate/lactate/ureidoglycolate dehydrogenase
MIEADAGARLPGTRRLALRAKAEREGILLDAELVGEARALARG